MPQLVGNHAVVIGAGMAGLAAAALLGASVKQRWDVGPFITVAIIFAAVIWDGAKCQLVVGRFQPGPAEEGEWLGRLVGNHRLKLGHPGQRDFVEKVAHAVGFREPPEEVEPRAVPGKGQFGHRAAGARARGVPRAGLRHP